MAVNPNLESFTKMAMPLTMNRQMPQPIDATSIFTSLSAAQTYAQTSGVAYVGQILSVVESGSALAYIITNTAGDLEEIGTGAGASLVVANVSDLTSTVANDLEIGQTAFVTSEGKSYILTDTGDSPPSSYVWEELSHTDVVWQGTEDAVTFYALNQAAYDGIGSKTATTLYFTTDTGRIYRGTVDVTNSVIVTASIPAAASAIKGKLYINSDTLEAKVTTDGASFIDLSPGYVTTGSMWAEVDNDAKFATIKCIKDTIQSAIDTKVDKVTGAVEGNLATFVSGGNIQDAGVSIGGSTLEASPTATKVATEAAVDAAITQAISWKELT